MRSAFLILSDTKTFATKQDIRHTQTFESFEIQLYLKSSSGDTRARIDSVRAHLFCGVMLFTLLPLALLSRCGGGMIALYGNSGGGEAARRTHFFAS